MKRIEDVLSVEAVKAAYEALGLKPTRGAWAGDGCGCPAGVVALRLGAKADDLRQSEALIKVAAAIGCPQDEVEWFANGVDGEAPSRWELDPRHERIVAAHAHGKAVAAAVFGGATEGKDA